MPLIIPYVDDLVWSKVVSSKVGQLKVPLQQCSEPCFLMSLIPHLFAKPLFCLVVVKMHNLPESVHFAQELCLLVLMAKIQRQEALQIQGISWKSNICCLALIAGLQSCVRVLVNYWCPTLKVVYLVVPVLLLLQLEHLVLGAHYWRQGRQQLRLSFRVLTCLWLDIEDET